ncbi:hypothetical protein ACQP4Q_04175 [Actinobacillus pleuropneumoniae]|uniref:Uncharacterized protein n=5 Tax=Actinobacillus pleuropneumoniae TaxID=715 RepID=A3N0E8_ACTP2|nr:hypothetical protein [Actinobacillus pleuropneumoniae]ABN73884.1 hypothetical protein APL_0786 [Actinobacillus pleuropneumoniae serovar 5b str. L20]ABY69354.1 hypothetical protein APJL_0791 [Actinobacillus pleuropneumoniae serovar 3 str. JL03]EFL78942.1 hypothetical protein APP2_1265 [Actinobacillus pleuropneumoniae serovar 2 str. 4226]EFL80126.1 hypothetical protein APP6_2233 [Actinobacillus pleuropneumoniae serovar 6 str. Femo]MBT9318232.1 hypothetical protein [Actinobacillus pleuropneumo
MKETKNSALITAQAFYYQSIVALEKCFEMEEGDIIYLEQDGDVSHRSNNLDISSQSEVKDVQTPLTDHSKTFWNTLNNWLAPEFNHSQYKYLILYTTQSFGKTAQLATWNDRNPQEKFQILTDIYSSSTSESKIAKMQKDILNMDHDSLIVVIEKIVLITEADNKDEILSKIKRTKLFGIPENNQQVFIENLIGFIYELGNEMTWCIRYDQFQEKFIDLTSQYSRKEFTFPEFRGMDATVQEIAENEDKQFVRKIKDIEYEDVISEAIGNWLEFERSLMQDLDYSPVYLEKTQKYQVELINKYKGKYRTAQRNKKDPKDMYDEIIYSEPMLIGNIRPHLAYRNGVIHDAMDTNPELTWDTRK